MDELSLPGSEHTQREGVLTPPFTMPVPGTHLLGSDVHARLAAEALAGYVYDYDPATRLVARSAGFTQVTGWPVLEETATAEWWRSVVHPDDIVHLDAALSGAIADPACDHLSADYRVRHRDGHWIWLLDRIRIVRDEGGRAIRVVGGVNDISDRVEVERALAESEARYRALVLATSQLIWHRRAYGTGDAATDAWWLELTGQSAAEANDDGGWGWIAALHPDDRERARRAWAEAFERRVLFDVEYRVRRRDGSYAHLAVRGVPVGDDPSAGEWIGTFTDVTSARTAEAEREALLHAEQAARAAAERIAEEREENARLLRTEVARRTPLVATLDQAQNFIGIATLDGRAMYVNPAGRNLVGLGVDVPANDTRIVDYFPTDWQPRVLDEILPALLRDGEWRGEVSFRHFVTGEEMPFEWNPFVVRDALSNEAVALACIARDLREERAARAERERLLAAAESANRAKSDFLAVMSHELRTPLNAIGGYVDLLEMEIRGPITAEQRADLQRIRAAQRTLLRHINDILNFAKLEAGRVEFDLRDVPVSELLATVEPLVLPLASAKSISYACSAPESLVVRVDPEKGTQVLLNLVANAVKFTPHGGAVTVSARADADWVEIEVRDNGVGIRSDRLGRIFDPFVQVQPSGVPRQEGTGLGLAISRDLVRGMGGELTAASEVGSGSTFTVRLPKSR